MSRTTPLQPNISGVTQPPLDNPEPPFTSKGLGIDVGYRKNAIEEDLRRGESASSVNSTDAFIEEELRASEWLRHVLPNATTFKNHFKELFQFLAWITRYNTTWLLGDIIAGEWFP
jgi:sodium-independent sulfate anion transporter 11